MTISTKPELPYCRRIIFTIDVDTLSGLQAGVVEHVVELLNQFHDEHLEGETAILDTEVYVQAFFDGQDGAVYDGRGQ